MRYRSARFLFGSLPLGLCLAGCVSTPGIKLPKSTTVRATDKAASVLISPTMVAPWTDVSAALKPNFTMSGDTAASQVLPTTEQISSQVLNAFGFSLGIGLPGSSTSSSATKSLSDSLGSNTASGTTTSTAANQNTTTSTTTTTSSPGTAPATPTGIPVGATLPSVSAATGALGFDPVLKFKAANYLNQEVQLLNQEIDHVATRNCFVPYVVKLKIGVMTYRPDLGYSIHTRVSFFNSDGSSPPVPGAIAQGLQIRRYLDKLGKSDPATAAAVARVPAVAATVQAALATSMAAHVAPECMLQKHVPVVVPLLVADDLEVALKSRAAEAAEQIGLALNFMLHGVGVNTAANNVRQALTAISSQQLSSGLTVSRDNDNTLYVHIAPNNQASGDPTLTGQTYDAAVLLLIPRTYFGWEGDGPTPAQISLVTYTQFRDAKSSRVLDAMSPADQAAKIDRVVRVYLHDEVDLKAWDKLSSSAKIDRAGGLMNAIKAGDMEQFQDSLASGSLCNGDYKVDVAGVFGNIIADSAIKDAATRADAVRDDLAQLQSDGKNTGLRDQTCRSLSIAPALWTGLSSVISDQQYKSARFEAPVPTPITIQPQTVLAADDKSHPIQVAVANVSGISASTLGARLDVAVQRHSETANVTKTTISLPAQSIVLDSTAHTLTVTFQSLGKSGLTIGLPSDPVPASGKAGGGSATDANQLAIDPDGTANAVVISTIGCDEQKQLCPILKLAGAEAPTDQTVKLGLQLLTSPKSPSAPAVTLGAAGGSIVIAQGGIASLPITISKFPAKDIVALSLAGASVGGIGAGLTLGEHGYSAGAAGTYTLQLQNLRVGDVITLTAQAYKPDGKTSDGDPATVTYTAIADLPTHR